MQRRELEFLRFPGCRGRAARANPVPSLSIFLSFRTAVKMPLCCARAIMAMSVALVLGLVPSVAYAAAMGTTTGLAVQAINTSVSQASQSQHLSASEDGDALFRPLPSNTGTASVSRKRKSDGKHTTCR